jgi:ParB family chromosome partitioning protein
MKRSISSSVLKKKADRIDSKSPDAPNANDLVQTEEGSDVVAAAALKPRMGGSGSAWKAGALSEAQTELNARRATIADDIMHGRHELQLSPDQISDEIGSDRRVDWKDQDAFGSLQESIEKNGQDTPIQVWPTDPSWRPDPLNPESVTNVSFLLITGRRRHAIATRLGRPVRAILADPDTRGAADDKFEMLFMRFRENEERENLGAFERLLSIGEMFERYEFAGGGKKVTAVSFADRIGVHESLISRGKAVYKAREEILHTCKNVYDMSYRDLEQALTNLTQAQQTPNKKPTQPQKLVVTRALGSRRLSVASQNGKLSVSAAGMNLDKPALEGLSDVIAAYLQEHGSKE